MYSMGPRRESRSFLPKPHAFPSLSHTQAVHWAIDELKATVPIWKKEMFADGGVWKENPESRALLLRASVHNTKQPLLLPAHARKAAGVLSWVGLGAALVLPILNQLNSKRTLLKQLHVVDLY
jgi:hypothetical protein